MQVFENTLRPRLQKKVESMMKSKQEWNPRITISVSRLTDLVKILSEGRKPPYFLGGLARSLISMTVITIMKHSNMKAIKVSTSRIREEQYQEDLRQRKRSKLLVNIRRHGISTQRVQGRAEIYQIIIAIEAKIKRGITLPFQVYQRERKID
jgi:hypothetical protein